MNMDIFDRLKQAAAPQWHSYVDHAFVQQMGDGTLSEAAFRAYLVQDYLFLIQFARAWALAAYKSRCLPISVPLRRGSQRFSTKPTCTCVCAHAGA